MNPEIIAALARHILTLFAGGMAAKYGIDGGAMDAIIGGAAALAGVGWSMYDQKKGE